MNDFKLKKGQSLPKRLIELKNNKRNSQEYIDFALNNPSLKGVKLNKAFTETKPFINNIQLTGKWFNNYDHKRPRIDIEYICQCGNILKAPFKDKVKDKNKNKCTCKVKGKNDDLTKSIVKEYFENLIKTPKYNKIYESYEYESKHLPKSIKEKVRYHLDNKQYNNILIKAPTGSGKTFMIVNNFTDDDFDSHSILILPNTMNIKQVEKDYRYKRGLNIQCLYGGSDDFDPNGGMVVCTPDSIEKIIKSGYDFDFHTIFIDEAHIYAGDYDYRAKAFFLLQEFSRDIENKIFITATPTNSLDLNSFTSIIEYIPLNKEDVPTNVFIYDKVINTNRINDFQEGIIKEAERLYKENQILGSEYNKCILLDMKYQNIELIVDKINIPENEKSKLKSEFKESVKTHESIIENELLDVFFLGTTDLFSNGANILNKSNFHIFIIDNKIAPKVKQFIARSRKALSITVHIFNKYNQNENNYNMPFFEDKLTKKKDEINKLLDIYNQKKFSGITDNRTTDRELLNILGAIEKKYNTEYRISIPDKKFTYIFYDTQKGKFAINNLAIVNSVYQDYYNLITKEGFKLQLKEYFKNVKSIKGSGKTLNTSNQNKNINLELPKKRNIKEETLRAISMNEIQNEEINQEMVSRYNRLLKKHKRKNVAFFMTEDNPKLKSILKTYNSLEFIRTGKNKTTKENVFMRDVHLSYVNLINEDIPYTSKEIEVLLIKLKKDKKLEDPISKIRTRFNSVFYSKSTRPYIIQNGKSKQVKANKFFIYNRALLLLKINEHYSKYNLEFKLHDLTNLITIFKRK